MNCDQAFDCLTDSRRRHSADLERHLAACPRCRQMHDTLEPALDLFDGVVEEPDLSGLVRDSRPLVSTESRQLAEQTAARLVTAGGPRLRRGNWTGFVRYSAVFICGALVVLVLGAVFALAYLFSPGQGLLTRRRRPSARGGRTAAAARPNAPSSL